MDSVAAEGLGFLPEPMTPGFPVHNPILKHQLQLHHPHLPDHESYAEPPEVHSWKSSPGDKHCLAGFLLIGGVQDPDLGER